MRVEDLNNVLPPWPESNLGAGDTLAHIPISPPEGRRTTVKSILDHCALFDGPSAQDGEAATKGATVVELAIGKDLAGMATDGAVVVLSPAFLEGDDVRSRGEQGKLAADLVKTGGAEGGDVQETPAVEGEEVELGGESVLIVDGRVGGGRRDDFVDGGVSSDGHSDSGCDGRVGDSRSSLGRRV